MSPQTLKPKSLSKKQLKMAKLYGCTALGHSLALRTAGLLWKDLTSRVLILGTHKYLLKDTKYLRLSKEEGE
jgi:hypothetical protein